EDTAAVHHQHRRAVDRRLGVHRVHKGDIVHAGGEIRKEVADPLAAAAVLLELPLRADDAALVLVPGSAERLDGDRLAIERIELRLVVEGVNVTRSAIAEDEDNALRLRLEGGLFGRQRINELADAIGRDSLPLKEVRAEQPREGDTSEPS